MERNYCIYCHTRLSTNQKYIGQTKNLTPKYRWNNGKGYQFNSRFYEDILNDGWEIGFSHEILKSNLTSEEANFWEDYYIKFYNTMVPKYGYNLKDGGGNLSPEGLQNISKSQKARYSNENERKKTSKAVKVYYKNKPELIAKISQRQKAWCASNPEKMKQIFEASSYKVRCLETNIIYNSISEASRLLNIERKGINNCVLKYQRTAGGYHWAEANSNITIEEIDLFFKKRNLNTRRIKCIETNEIFFSIADAKRKYGGDIGACLNGRQKTAGIDNLGNRLHWKYLNNDEEETDNVQ